MWNSVLSFSSDTQCDSRVMAAAWGPVARGGGGEGRGGRTGGESGGRQLGTMRVRLCMCVPVCALCMHVQHARGSSGMSRPPPQQEHRAKGGLGLQADAGE